MEYVGKWRFNLDTFFLIAYCIEMNYITQKISFNVPQNGGDQYRLYECVDQIADLIDMYFGTAIEDTTNIHRLVDEELVVAMRRQARENELENINGGSK